MINKKINIDKHDLNTTVHAVYGCTSMVSYGIRPYRLPYHQLITQIPDGTGAGAIIQHRTTIDVWHGAQPYVYALKDITGFGWIMVMVHLQETTTPPCIQLAILRKIREQ